MEYITVSSLVVHREDVHSDRQRGVLGIFPENYKFLTLND